MTDRPIDRPTDHAIRSATKGRIYLRNTAIRPTNMPCDVSIIEYKTCVLVYKCLPQSAPIYLSESCIPVAATATRSHLRSAVQGNLVISYWRIKRYGQRSFAYSGPALWNSLRLTVHDPSLSLRATTIRHALQSTTIHSHSASAAV